MKILLKFAIISVPFLVSACLNITQDVILYPDGSGEMHIDYWMILPDEDSRRVADKIGIFNPDSIRSEFSSEQTQITNVNVFSDSTDSTTHAIVDFTFERIDSLNKTNVFSYEDFSFKEGTSGQIIFTQFIPPIATGFGINAADYNVTYRYTFSGTILFHNAHKANKSTLTWAYSLDQIGGGKSIEVIFRPYKLKETPDWIYMLTGSVLILVIFFLFRRKKD
jgi:hypothetical protein